MIESERGHDEKDVPAEKVAEEINQQLKDGKWVTVEKKDGSTDLLTSATPTEAPKVETKAEKKDEDWKDVLGGGKKDDKPLETKDIKSVTATSKVKGG